MGCEVIFYSSKKENPECYQRPYEGFEVGWVEVFVEWLCKKGYIDSPELCI